MFYQPSNVYVLRKDMSKAGYRKREMKTRLLYLPNDPEELAFSKNYVRPKSKQISIKQIKWTQKRTDI